MKRTGSSKEHYRFTSVLEQSTNKLWGAHVRVPTRIATELKERNVRRVVCSLNGSSEFQTAILPYKTGVFVIRVNKSLRDKLGLDFGSKVSVVLHKDVSKYGLPLPDEFKELLRQDKEGNRLFHALTLGKQRTLLYIIGKGKDMDLRIAQGIIIINHLKANNGAINYRRLSASLKALHH